MTASTKPTQNERSAVRSFLALNPIEITVRQHLTDARIWVRCVFCAALAESTASATFIGRPTLAHLTGCPWLSAAVAFPDLYRPRCHYCPGSPEGVLGEPCAHCERVISPGRFYTPPPAL